ncbi:unnamed protein product [Absidia cylindrospora]
MSSNPLESTAGKRIALPVRGLAMGLLNFGDRIGRLSAVLFTIIAMGVMLYALYTFHWRATRIRNREAAPYDDRVGPTVLCILMLAAVITNFWLRLGDQGNP